MSQSPYADLERPPLTASALSSALISDGGLWRELRLVAETGSTGTDAAVAARSGVAEGLVIVAEHQSAGRGRLDRSWVSPPRAGLTASVLLRPPVPRDRWGLLTLLVAGATARALRQCTGVAVQVKWPNDLIVGDRKLAGVLAEVVGDAAIVGLGLNVSTRSDELPSGATSLQIETGEVVDRAPVLIAVLRGIATAYDQWVMAGGAAAAVLPAYQELSATLGRDVQATLPGGGLLTGRAVELDGVGRLVIQPMGAERQAVAVGDVVHLR